VGGEVWIDPSSPIGRLKPTKLKEVLPGVIGKIRKKNR
jgi:hypothetical protein